MLRRFCNITGQEIDMNSILDVAPKIQLLLAPLNSNLHPMLALLTFGMPFEVTEMAFAQREDGGVDLQLGIQCESFKDMDTETFSQALKGAAAEAYIVDHPEESDFYSISIPFKGKKS